MDPSGLSNPEGFVVSLWDIRTRGPRLARAMLFPASHEPSLIAKYQAELQAHCEYENKIKKGSV
jgi:hypothetical protein